MKILIGDKGHVDFDGPILMSEDEYKQFIRMMKSLYAVVEIEKADDFRTERLGEKPFQKKWTEKELRFLLEIEDTDTVAEKLGRTWMSVDIMRGKYLPDFMMWVNEKGYDLVRDDIKILIEEYIKEKEKNKEELKQNRKRKKEELRLYKEKVNGLEKKLKAINLRISCGHKIEGDEDHIRQIKNEIEKLKIKIQEMEEV